MNNDSTWHEVVMARADLLDLPQESAQAAGWQLPPGFSLRPYQSGDDKIWTEIHRRADHFNLFDEETFARCFGTDEAILQQRMRFLLAPDGTPIGTTTAWFDSPDVGRVHWVAILPMWQGKQLGRALVAETLRLLRELGHSRAILSTDSRRQNAIALYQRAGFTIDGS